MNRDEVLSGARQYASRVIQKESAFRVAYLNTLYEELAATERNGFSQLRDNTFWAAVYAYINWLAHLRVTKAQDVSIREISDWLAEALGWDIDIATAFWMCGRNPTVHTGNRNQGFTTNINGKKMHIQLMLDEPQGWGTDKTYMALPVSKPQQSKKGFSPLPTQQILFWYKPLATSMDDLTGDILVDIAQMEYNRLCSLQKTCEALGFIQDDGSIYAMKNLLIDVYPHTKSTS